MRISILFFFLIISSMVQAQDLAKKLKVDSVSISPTGRYAIAYKGKKSGLYDVKNGQFEIPLSKTFLYPYQGKKDDFLDCYFQFGKDGAELVVYTRDGKEVTMPFNGEKIDLFFCTDSLNEECNQLIVVNHLGCELIDDNENKDLMIYSNTNLSFDQTESGLLILNNLRRPEIDYDIMGIAFIKDSGIAHSGVFDPANKVWLLPPAYVEINEINNYFFCRKLDEFKGSEYNYTLDYSYDVFRLEDGQMKMLIIDYGKLSDHELADVLKVDRVENMGDDMHYRTVKDGKYGFVTFSLNWFHYPTESERYFTYENHFVPEYDYANYSPDHRFLLAAKWQDSSSSYVISANYLDFRTDRAFQVSEYKNHITTTTKYIGVSPENHRSSIVFTDKGILAGEYDEHYDLVFAPLEPTNLSWFGNEGNFGLELVNNQLLVVQDFEEFERNWTPLRSTEYPGEDSINEYGEVVYAPDIIPESRTGVYDLVKKEWFIEPRYRRCLVVPEGFLVEEIWEDPYELGAWDLRFHLIDFEKNYIFSNLTKDSILNNPDLFMLTIDEYKPDSIFKAPSGFFSHSLTDRGSFYYCRSGNNYFVISPFEYFPTDRKKVGVPKEFVHYNPDLNASYFLENDSIYLQLDSNQWAVSQQYGEIRLEYEFSFYSSGSENYKVILSEKRPDQIWRDSIGSISSYSQDKIVKSSIAINHGFLIINENNSGSYYEEINEIESRYGSYTIERECSSVWKKKDGRWEKVSPYYALVQPVEFGFIVKTGDYYSRVPKENAEWNWEFEGYESDEKLQTGRYLILDTNLNAIQFLDWFDFSYVENLGFGIKVCMDNGCFLIDNAGHPITEERYWHEFVLEGDTITAIQYDAFDIRNPGKSYIDEYGDFIEPLILNTKKYVLK